MLFDHCLKKGILMLFEFFVELFKARVVRFVYVSVYTIIIWHKTVAFSRSCVRQNLSLWYKIIACIEIWSESK